MKFDDTEIEKYKLHQHKSPFLIDNTDINNIVVSNKVKRKYFIGYKDAKKLDLYVYSFQKWVHTEAIVIKLNIKDEKWLEKYSETWKKSATLSKKNLTVNLYTMKYF